MSTYVLAAGAWHGGWSWRRVAADRVPERVGRIVMVDAWAGRDGESIDSRAPGPFLDWLASATVAGVVPVPPLAALGVDDPAGQAFLGSCGTPHPRLAFAEPTRLTGAVDAVPTSAVVCVPGGGVPFAQWAGEFGWPVTAAESGHMVMVTAPRALAAALQEA